MSGVRIRLTIRGKAKRNKKVRTWLRRVSRQLTARLDQSKLDQALQDVSVFGTGMVRWP